jgi:hypothetical protein
MRRVFLMPSLQRQEKKYISSAPSASSVRDMLS